MSLAVACLLTSEQQPEPSQCLWHHPQRQPGPKYCPTLALLGTDPRGPTGPSRSFATSLQGLAGDESCGPCDTDAFLFGRQPPRQLACVPTALERAGARLGEDKGPRLAIISAYHGTNPCKLSLPFHECSPGSYWETEVRSRSQLLKVRRPASTQEWEVRCSCAPLLSSWLLRT